MRRLARFTARLGLAVVLTMVAAPAWGLDRHVYLDTDGDGQLNDCPNPAHNASGQATTDPLFWCQGGSQAGRIIGTVAGHTSSSACTGGGGTVQPVVNGTVADVDGDGTPEPIYGHPQACVWNMAKSDSCEVHAGSFTRSGAMCDEDCGFGSLGGSLDSCDKYDCFFASVVALGDGPNMDGTGYGTDQAPAYLRAAEMNGSVDTWDTNGDKAPDSTPAAVLSGDRNGNHSFEATTCSGNSCSGDAFYGLILGCGGSGGYGSSFCRPDPPAGATRIKIDSDADGSFDTEVGATGQQNVDHFIIKDLTFTRYNGGSGGSSGARSHEGTLGLEGNEDGTDGIVVDHIYMHDNDYALSPSRENQWAAISDNHNHLCQDFTEIKNSFLVQNNEKLTDNDCGPGDECGCPINMHDNRILMDVTSPRATNRLVVLHYWKSIDRVGNGTRAKQMRFWNNEVILKNPGSSKTSFSDLQLPGNGQGTGDGEIWIYGNVFRNHPAMSQKWKRFWSSFCTTQANGTGSWRTYFFNNTFDTGATINQVCGDGMPGELLVEKNNAYFANPGIHLTTNVLKIIRANEIQTLDPADGDLWFDRAGASLETHTGLQAYVPRAGGPLDGTGNCDPDGDGVAGVDYDFDGVNDLTWTDLMGHQVNCPTAASPLNAGAIQPGASTSPPPPPPPPPPGNSPPATPTLSIAGVSASGVTVQGSPFSDPDAGDSHAASQFQVDLTAGSFTSPVADSKALPPGTVLWSASGLNLQTPYKARLRYQDSSGVWSTWSTAVTFSTTGDTTPPSDVPGLRRTDTDAGPP